MVLKKLEKRHSSLKDNDVKNQMVKKSHLIFLNMLTICIIKLFASGNKIRVFNISGMK